MHQGIPIQQIQKINGIQLGKGRMKSISGRRNSLSKGPGTLFLLLGDGIGRMLHGIYLLQGAEWSGFLKFALWFYFILGKNKTKIKLACNNTSHRKESMETGGL